MPGSSAAAEVRALLREAFAAKLEPAGWRTLGGDDEDLSLVFISPVKPGFAATAEVSRGVSFPDRRPVVVSVVSVGVSFEPLRRLWPLLGEFPAAVAEEPVWSAAPPVPGGEGREPEHGVPPLEVWGAGGAERAADELAPLILERAPAFAQRNASLDALLEEPGFAELYWDWDIRRAALLAAAGRFEEARASLEHLRPPASPRTLPFSRRQRRAARQLRRWIDSRGDLALIPASPPPSPSPFAHRERKPLWEALSQAHAEEAKRRSAVEAVKNSARGKSRDEARRMLRQELARRGAADQSPLWIEDTLDHLWDSPTDQMQQGIRALKGAGRFALAAARAIRDRQLPDLSPPDWAEPPDHALYEFPSTEPVVAVDLDPDAAQWLERVHDAVPTVAGSCPLTTWLKPAPPGADPAPGLVICLGEQVIGSVPPDAVPAYRQVVEDAAFRDENPCVQARLTRRDWGYLLEIARPA